MSTQSPFSSAAVAFGTSPQSPAPSRAPRAQSPQKPPRVPPAPSHTPRATGDCSPVALLGPSSHQFPISRSLSLLATPVSPPEIESRGSIRILKQLWLSARKE